MNIDLRDSLLRFTVPPALFWSTLIYFDNTSFISDISEDTFLMAVIFVASGFVISAIGAIFTLILDCIFGPVWHKAKRELNYWIDLGKYKYARDKVATKWLFYYLNINSAIALVLAWFWHQSGDLYYLLLIIIFCLLAFSNYKRCYDYGKEIMELKMSKIKTESSFKQ